VARAALLAVLASILVAPAAAAMFDQPRSHGPRLGPAPSFVVGAPLERLAPPPCPRATIARVEALASLLRDLPLGGMLDALVGPERVCARPARRLP
jgi:hypothetical protein